MKRLFAVTMLLVAAFSFFGCATHPAHPGWVALINGDQGLDNFNRIGDANWRAESGAIVADKGKGGYLVSKNSYKDFEIYAEFWADDTANSGIHFRASEPANIADTNSYEANIYDQRPDPLHGTGAITRIASVPVPPIHKTGGKWNTYEIYANGPEITVKLNGVVTVSIRDTKYVSGPIALQYGAGPNGAQGGAIKWRKVQIRTL